MILFKNELKTKDQKKRFNFLNPFSVILSP